MSTASAPAPAPAAVRAVPAAERQIRVMIVDDAVVARSMMTRWIDAEPDMMIAASARSGREALDRIEATDPDVVLLDVDMPELDGITALPLLLRKQRDLDRRVGAQRPRGVGSDRGHRSGRGAARRRYAGARRHHRVAASSPQAARPRRDHGVDLDAAQRRTEPARAVARRHRLHPEAGNHLRGDDLGGVSPRADRQGPQSWQEARYRPRAGAAARSRRAGECKAGDTAPCGRARAAPPRTRADRLAAVLFRFAARAADRLLDGRAASAEHGDRKIG